MPIIFKSGGKSLDIEDLPLDIYIDIESACSIRWYELISNPYRNPKAGKMLAEAAAKHLDVELPPLTPKTLTEVFVAEVAENRPQSFTDGQPDPKAQASDPATT